MKTIKSFQKIKPWKVLLSVYGIMVIIVVLFRTLEPV